MNKFIAYSVAMLLTTGVSQAQDMGSEKTIGLALALDMVTAAVESCTASGYNTAAVVVDRSGYMKALVRADNARPHAIEIAERKAHTASMLGYETSKLAENIAAGVTPSSLLLTPKFTSLLGGFPIKSGDEVVGGIGVSGAPGGEKDAACVQAAFDVAKDRMN